MSAFVPFRKVHAGIYRRYKLPSCADYTRVHSHTLAGADTSIFAPCTDGYKCFAYKSCVVLPHGISSSFTKDTIF